MIGSSANLSTGGYVTETAAVPGHSSGLAAVVRVSRFEPPAPLLALSYTGRVLAHMALKPGWQGPKRLSCRRWN
jgi:hypothetical protein